MTHTSTEQERQEFEAWAVEEGLHIDRNKYGCEERYASISTQSAFRGWQAKSRAQAVNGKGWCTSGTSMIDGHAISAPVPQIDPVHGDCLPPIGSRVFIRHGRDYDAHACIVTGYYAWGDLKGSKHLHRVFVRLVYEGTDTKQARMLCDCYATAEDALAAAPQPPEAACNPSMQPVATAFFTEKGEVAFTGIYDRTLKALEAVKTTRMGISSGSIDLYAAPQPPACNPSMQPELATQSPESNSHEFDGIKAEDDAEREALRDVYEAARGLLRYEGVDDGRAIIYRAKLNNAIEDVKQIDGGLWEPPEAAQLDDIGVADMAKRAALSAGPGIQKAVQALIDAAILEGGALPPSQEAAMQATDQRKADLLKLLEPFIGTPLNE